MKGWLLGLRRKIINGILTIMPRAFLPSIAARRPELGSADRRICGLRILSSFDQTTADLKNGGPRYTFRCTAAQTAIGPQGQRAIGIEPWGNDPQHATRSTAETPGPIKNKLTTGNPNLSLQFNRSRCPISRQLDCRSAHRRPAGAVPGCGLDLWKD